MLGTALFGMALESALLRPLYARDHLSQVLATFALILIINDGTRMVFGTDRPLSVPAAFDHPVMLPLGFQYPAWRLVIIATGLVLALALYLLVQRTRLGALVRAGASNREMSSAMGVDVPTLFTAVFGLGAALCAVAGALLGPLLAVQVGMGETILIPAFVVVVIGGIGSMRGALVGALLVGLVDTLGRTLLQQALRETLPPQWASAAGPALASVAVYVLMAAVLVWRPQGLLPVRGR
jgi:branched-chain amino acid transport system permease protein